jgi:hypothetical protein
MKRSAKRHEHVGNRTDRHIGPAVEELRDKTLGLSESLCELGACDAVLLHELADELSGFDDRTLLLVQPHPLISPRQFLSKSLGCHFFFPFFVSFIWADCRSMCSCIILLARSSSLFGQRLAFLMNPCVNTH